MYCYGVLGWSDPKTTRRKKYNPWGCSRNPLSPTFLRHNSLTPYPSYLILPISSTPPNFVTTHYTHTWQHILQLTHTHSLFPSLILANYNVAQSWLANWPRSYRIPKKNCYVRYLLSRWSIGYSCFLIKEKHHKIARMQGKKMQYQWPLYFANNLCCIHLKLCSLTILLLISWIGKMDSCTINSKIYTS